MMFWEHQGQENIFDMRKYDYCAICKRRISNTESGKFYCVGHSLYEIAKKLQQYKQTSILTNIYK